MKLPKLQNSKKYVGLYIFDFGDHTGVGFTAEEIAELLESEKYKHGKVYKIHKAYPDGKLELKGVPAETFQLEAGMFFYSADLKTAKHDFKQLVNLAVKSSPPCRAKIHLAKYSDSSFAVPTPPKQPACTKRFGEGRLRRLEGPDKSGLLRRMDNKFAVALIYPAEYDDEVSSWLLDGQYKTAGAAEGGVGAVQRYYDYKPEILERHQLLGQSDIISRTGEELLTSLRLVVQR
jgi:hypothetical protein